MPTENDLVTASTVDSGGHAVVTVQGEVDAANVTSLSAAISSSIGAGGCLTIDFSGVDFVDSSGIRCLLQARLDADQASSGFRIIGVQPNPMRIFQIAGVDAVLACEPAPTSKAPRAVAPAATDPRLEPGTPPLAIV